MLDTVRRGADRASRLTRAAALRHERKSLPGRSCHAAARGNHRARRPRDDRRRQSEAGGFSRLCPGEGRSCAGTRPAHGAVCVALPEHLAVFERGIANRLDFAFAGPQSRRLAELVANGTVKVGAIHTYLELYCARAGRSDAARGAHRRRQGGSQRQPLHWPQYRRHADHRRGRSVPRRHCRRAGQQDCRSAAPRRRTRRLGRCRGAGPDALSDRSAIHARSRLHCARRRSAISPTARRKPRPRSRGPPSRRGRNCCAG